MSDRPKTRQELYDRIRASSRDEVTLEEMIRFGFWPRGGQLPEDPADEVRRLAELGRELGALADERRTLANVAALKQQAHEARLAASRQRQAETKTRRLAERAARAAAWREKQQHEIVFLGDGVSAGLADKQGDDARVQRQGLPLLPDGTALAAAMGIGLGELRFLSFARAAAQVSHYKRFTLPKKTGGERLISAPMPRLKRAQHWILEHLLAKLPVSPEAHGFVPGRSIVSNARPHVGATVIVNLDLKDFFPSIELRRVKGLFRSYGYGEHTATILALLCTEPDVETVALDGLTYHVATSARHLPQGAPTSPAITNSLCARLDKRLAGLARKQGFTYTRYADDLTFSTRVADDAPVARLLARVRWILGQEGFTVHPDKTRVLRRGRRQEVTGLVVNDRLGVPRDTLRRFRALLHRVERHGVEGARWGESQVEKRDLFASMRGFVRFVHMVDPDKARPLAAQVEALARRAGR